MSEVEVKPTAYKPPSFWRRWSWSSVVRWYWRKAEDLIRWGLRRLPMRGNLVLHCLREFQAAGFTQLSKAEGPDRWMQENLIELVALFASQHHSGFSAGQCAAMANKLFRFQPLVPLTGEPEEWVDCGEGVFQNRRCSHVFKDATLFDGQPYDIRGRVFVDPDGMAYTNRDSHVPITFPYTPTIEYVKVAKEEGA